MPDGDPAAVAVAVAHRYPPVGHPHGSADHPNISAARWSRADGSPPPRHPSGCASAATRSLRMAHHADHRRPAAIARRRSAMAAYHDLMTSRGIRSSARPRRGRLASSIPRGFSPVGPPATGRSPGGSAGPQSRRPPRRVPPNAGPRRPRTGRSAARRSGRPSRSRGRDSRFFGPVG